ncbi:exported hypothetical protein [metagenome]|uniref:Hemolysin-type calcium-binding region n=1 Tax=metagenome TaxID=256318 RepID=A0A2P2C1S5_9ZZZZ
MRRLLVLSCGLLLSSGSGLVSGPTVGAEAASARPRCQGVVATIVGDGRDNTLRGTKARDVIVAGGGNDWVKGRGGDDLICGGPGLDGLDGGRGDDRIFGGTDLRYLDEGETVLVGDDLWGGPGDDRITPGLDRRSADRIARDRVRWDHGIHAVRVDLRTGRATGQGRDRFTPTHVRIVATDRGDTVIGSDRADWVLTGDGSDTVRAAGGDDVVWADSAPDGGPDGSDIAYGGRGDDQLYGENGSDRLFGGPGSDQVFDDGESADTVWGGPGRDLVGDQMVSDAAGGLQSVDGGTGRDFVNLFSRFVNPDGLAGPPSHGTLDMSSGAMAYADPDDTVTMTLARVEVIDFLTWGTSWQVTGTSGADVVCAGGTNGTTFDALGGDDSFQGSAGDDVFDGGPGIDTLIGTSVGDDQLVDVESASDTSCGDFLAVQRRPDRWSSPH